jgi:hypothetical protein
LKKAVGAGCSMLAPNLLKRPRTLSERAQSCG